ncbi:MAG: tRNA (adenosine(37)-N6)-threonylcarbamoyltransferase complex dimerization subunit type 1 TsaB [Deltaproteobacteria bacterium]|nr:tRNA (adenosine(37)-N6)-threonylcarbamoyltransferase complex dimerization subunit type 1 TsaB [Deltaproteobacteria bacterium]
MLVAALDTATLTLSCALCELRGAEVELICERTEHGSAKAGPGATGGHGGRLPGALRDLLVAVDRKLGEVEGYAVGLGPGSFTGLRVGLATWKGLAYANQRPIAGVSSLAALALAAVPAAPEGALLLPLLDARKGEVYAGFYRRSGAGVEAEQPDAALGPQALLERAASLSLGGRTLVAFGEGYEAYRSLLGGKLPALPGVPATPPAHAVARLAAARLGNAAFDPAAVFALEPHYVRKSEAEVKFPDGFGPGAGKGVKS